MIALLAILIIAYGISLFLDKKDERDRKRWDEKHSNNLKDSAHPKP